MTGGIAIKEFLNVELPKVEQRRVDLAMLLADDSILHLEFQSTNDSDIPFRMGQYHLLLAQRYRRRLRHIVLYVGKARMRMADRFDTGPMQFAFELTDIHEISVDTLLRSETPADYALAILAGGGERRLREIVSRITKLKGPVRDRAVAQLIVLSGLRILPSTVVAECARMGVVIDLRKDPVFSQLWREAVAEGQHEGRQEGRQEGLREVLTDLLNQKFGRVPKWAADRLARGTTTQLERWARKVLTANTVEGVLGRKPVRHRTPG